MLKDLRQISSDYIHYCWNAIVNVGIYPGMPFIEVRRTKLLNLLAIPCIPFMLYFCILNFCQGRITLSAFNLTTSASAGMLLLMHKFRKYLWARTWVIMACAVIYAFTGFVYHNGAEYFLLNILIVTILVNDNTWYIVIVSILIILVFVGIVYFPQHLSWADPVPRQRVWLNVVVSLAFPIVGLTFFKRIQSDYQKEMEAQRQSLANMNKDKEKLFSIVAHDVRSPLATLEVLLDMFLKGEYPEKDMREAIEVLHEKVAQLGGSLDNVLRWSSRSMKGIQAFPANFPLEPLVVEVLYFFRLPVLQKKITVELQIPDELKVYADRDQVSVILRNLLSNALKFSFQGGTVTIGANPNHEQVAISFRDQGTGMTPKQITDLFSYRQHPEYGTNGERGTGLGLVLCKEFAQQNAGSIGVESLPGKGTSFTISLPIARSADEFEDDEI
ncbi:sensor histidine kinase KdpD [Chitinophaga sp. Cy-1792]|uniref:sensor histidine kinase n=1 Tax=Chitinophaga sp. Cy-1792 TaxID=2608339 RepID=UPI0014216677|nr:HAMP domain-containing sensor histidine kinase [Chitinophaga sp. Cy-1792]NIG55538.1 HAMP domain-containing histidine kinase [Chitinophaga sp. Cy-1792]